jgi:hypothetical protein
MEFVYCCIDDILVASETEEDQKKRLHLLFQRLSDFNIKKLRGFGPLANYADRATAACWRSSANFLRIEGVAWSAQRIPPVVRLGFLDRSR